MTKAEIIRELGLSLKKLVDEYNTVSKNPSISPGELDNMVTSSTKIIEYALAMKSIQAASNSNELNVKVRELEDKLRVSSEQMKQRDNDILILKNEILELQNTIETLRNTPDELEVNIPDVKVEYKENVIHEPIIKSEIHIPKIEEKFEPITIHPVDEPTNTNSSFTNEVTNNKDTVEVETLADKLMNTKVEDLKKVIPLHEKFLYIKDLFGSNSDHYNQFLEAMQTRKTLKEANELLDKAASMYNWDKENKVCMQFVGIMQRRFS